jgi:hypothetical protein
MGILARLLGRRRSPLDQRSADDAGDVDLETPRPTPTMRPIEAPKATPTTQPLDGSPRTAGTRSYGAPHGTPSTQRIHNPTRPGR